MHLTIRWKFILSIGLTLLVTYLALLAWDYSWQRQTAALQIQDLASERAARVATGLNERMTSAEQRAEAVAAQLQRQPASDLAGLQESLRNVPIDHEVRLVLADQAPTTAASAGPERNRRDHFSVTPAARFIGRGGRGGGFDRGNAPPGFEGMPPDRGGASDRGGPSNRGGFGPSTNRGDTPERMRGGGGGPPGGPRGGFRRGSVVQEIVDQPDTRDQFRLDNQAYAQIVRTPQTQWRGPFQSPEEPPTAVYCVPYVVNEQLRGVIVTDVAMDELDQGAPSPPATTDLRGADPRAPATAPATTRAASASLDADKFMLIDDEGRIRWPINEARFGFAPGRGPGAPGRAAPGTRGGRGAGRGPAFGPTTLESAIERARAADLPEFALALRSTLTGKHRVVRVADASAVEPLLFANEPYWIAMAQLPATGWVVAAAIPESQFMARSIERLWQRTVFLIAGLAVLLALTTFISIRITRPIKRMAAAVSELAAGNLDAHVSGVNSHDELGRLAGAFNTMTRQLKSHVAALTEQTAARESVEAELRIARQIQTALLPQEFPPFPQRRHEFEMHAVNVPAKGVAGDFFDYFFAPNDLLTIAIADVSGKGMPAALVMGVTRTIIRNLAMEGLSPAQIVDRANTMLIQDMSDSMFVTLFLMQYNTRDGTVHYVNAGHPPPYRIDARGGVETFGDVTGAILGVNPTGPDWAFDERSDRLEVGQTLMLYTDGVTEARAPDGSMLRSEGTEVLLRKYGAQSPKCICDHFVEELDRFQKGQTADDITIVTLRRNA